MVGGRMSALRRHARGLDAAIRSQVCHGDGRHSRRGGMKRSADGNQVPAFESEFLRSAHLGTTTPNLARAQDDGRVVPTRRLKGNQLRAATRPEWSMTRRACGPAWRDEMTGTRRPIRRAEKMFAKPG